MSVCLSFAECEYGDNGWNRIYIKGVEEGCIEGVALDVQKSPWR